MIKFYVSKVLFNIWDIYDVEYESYWMLVTLFGHSNWILNYV